jgi:hypothetical protein
MAGMQQQQGCHASGSGRRSNLTMRTKVALLQQRQQRMAAGQLGSRMMILTVCLSEAER